MVHHLICCTLTQCYNILFSHSTSLNQSPSRSSTKKYSCNECPKSFNSRSGLRRHINFKHMIVTQDGPLHCGEHGCTFRCRTLKTLRDHLQTVHDYTMKAYIYTFKTTEGNVHKYLLYMTLCTISISLFSSTLYISSAKKCEKYYDSTCTCRFQ